YGLQRTLPRFARNLYLYRNNLKNRFLIASAFPQNFCLRSCLVHAQWSLAPDENFEKPPCQIPDSSGCFGIKSNKPINKVINYIKITIFRQRAERSTRGKSVCLAT